MLTRAYLSVVWSVGPEMMSGRAGFVDEDGVDFVDDAVVVAALHLVGELELHVVAKVVEAELIVGAVGDVGRVGGATLGVVEIVDDDANGEAEEAVDFPHPLGIALGKVVVDRNDVDAAPGESVEIAGQGGDEGFALAGLHLGDLSGVEDHPADHLDVEVAHADGAAAGLANDGEGLWKERVQSFFFGRVDRVGDFGRAGLDGVGGDGDVRAGVVDANAELGGLLAKLVIREGLDGGLEGVDLSNGRHQALDGAFVGGAEDFGDGCVEHWGSFCGSAARARIVGEPCAEA